jgi:site-specific recombinase XerD
MKKPRWKGTPIPKAPGSPFVMYYKERFPELQVDVDESEDRLKVTQEKMKLASSQWKGMTEDEKKVYEGICKKATLAYKEHLKAFKEGLSEEEIKKLKKFKEKLKKYRKEQKEIKAGTYVEKPKVLSGYHLFMSDFIKTREEGTTAPVAMKSGASAWNSLSEDEKKKFKDKASKRNKKATKEYKDALLKMQADG